MPRFSRESSLRTTIRFVVFRALYDTNDTLLFLVVELFSIQTMEF